MHLPNKHVIRDVIQMSTVFEPRSSGGNVVSCALALNFDKNQQILQVFAVPLVERFQELKSIGFWVDFHTDFAPVGLGMFVSVLAGVEAS